MRLLAVAFAYIAVSSATAFLLPSPSHLHPSHHPSTSDSFALCICDTRDNHHIHSLASSRSHTTGLYYYFTPDFAIRCLTAVDTAADTAAATVVAVAAVEDTAAGTIHMGTAVTALRTFIPMGMPNGL